MIRPLMTALLLLLTAKSAAADGIAPGAYEIAYQLEVPHVEQFAVSRSLQVCLARRPGAALLALPVLSENNPLANCPASNIRLENGMLSFDILCPGRRNDRSEAHAVFQVTPGGFNGRIFMKMGGKNMTFVESQSGQRTGACNLASARP
jgi:hypothetical protein